MRRARERVAWSMLGLALLVLTTTPYDDARAELELERRALAAELARATTPKERERVLDRAEEAVLSALTQRLFPAWIGTPWAFHGTSDIPGEGEIACGMFVGTLLSHAGFSLDRIAFGRLAAEHIARSLTRDLRRWSDRPSSEVAREIERWGDGRYIIGLDFHVGFAVVTEGRARFIHSSIYPPSTVVDEPLDGENPFGHSRYRVAARILDRPMMERWLEANELRPHTAPRRRQASPGTARF